MHLKAHCIIYRPPPPRCVVEEEEYVVPGAYIKVNVKRVTQGHGCIHGCVLLVGEREREEKLQAHVKLIFVNIRCTSQMVS